MKHFLNVVAFALGMMTCSLYGCGAGPKVTVYISDPSQGGMQFYNENTGQSGFVAYSETDKFVAFNPADAQMLIDYCKLSQ